MRRMICFLLVIAVCMSMACPVFAATNSAADTGKPSQLPSSIGGNPRTGDMIMTWVFIMILALLALVVVYLCYRKFARK